MVVQDRKIFFIKSLYCMLKKLKIIYFTKNQLFLQQKDLYPNT